MEWIMVSTTLLFVLLMTALAVEPSARVKAVVASLMQREALYRVRSRPSPQTRAGTHARSSG